MPLSYIELSLGQSETLLYRARFPWFYHARGWAVLVVAALAAIASEIGGYGWPTAAIVLAGVLAFVATMAPLWTTEIGVTNQRFVYKRGWLWRTTQELQLRSVEEVNLEQGLLGRLFNFGRLELRGTGVDDIRLPSLADPVGLRKALQDGMAVAARPATVAAPVAIHSPVDSVYQG